MPSPMARLSGPTQLVKSPPLSSRSTITTGTPAWPIASSAAGAASIQAPDTISALAPWFSRSSTSSVSFATSPPASVERIVTFEKCVASSFTAASMPTK